MTYDATLNHEMEAHFFPPCRACGQEMAACDCNSQQEADYREMEKEQIQKMLTAALRRPPQPRELLRALAAWEGR